MADRTVKIGIVAEDQTAAAFAAVNARLGELNKLSDTVSSALGALGVGLALHEAGTFLEKVESSDAALARFSQRVGVSTEFLSQLGYAAKLNEVDMDTLSKGLKFLDKAIEDARQHGGPLRDVFNALGVDVASAAGKMKSTEEIVLEIADAFSRAADGPGKTAAAVKLFGRAGDQLIPTLNQGRASLAALATEAGKLGAVVSGEAARAAEEFEQRIKRVEEGAQGAARQFLSGLIPAINDVGDAFGRMNARAQFKDAGNEAGNWLKAVISLGDEAGYAMGRLADKMHLVELQNLRLLALQEGAKAPAGLVADYDRQIEQLQYQMKRNQGQEEQFQKDLRGQGGRKPGDIGGLLEGGDAAAAALSRLNQEFPVSAKGPQIQLADSALSERNEKAKTALLEAEWKRQEALAQTHSKSMLAALELEYKEGNVGLLDYLARKREITVAALQDELAAIARQYAAQQALVARLGKSSAPTATADRLEAQKKAQELASQYEKKAGEIVQEGSKAGGEQYAALKELRDFRLDTEAQIQAAQGNTAAAALDQIRKEFEERRRLAIAPQPQNPEAPTPAEARAGAQSAQDLAQLNKLQGLREAAAEAKGVAEQIDLIFAQMETKSEEVRAAVENGTLSELEGGQKIIALHRQTAASLDDLIRQYQALAAASENKQLIQAAAAMAAKVKEMGQEVSAFGKKLQEDFVNDFADAFARSAFSAKGWAAEFKKATESILEDILRLIAKMALLNVWQQTLGKVPGLGVPGQGSQGGRPQPYAINPNTGQPGLGPWAQGTTAPPLTPGGVGGFLQRTLGLGGGGKGGSSAAAGAEMRQAATLQQQAGATMLEAARQMDAAAAKLAAGGGGSGGGGLFGDLFDSGGSAGGDLSLEDDFAEAGLFAAGGAFHSDRPMIVGEKGPELLLPDHPGVILPADRTDKILKAVLAPGESNAAALGRLLHASTQDSGLRTQSTVQSVAPAIRAGQALEVGVRGPQILLPEVPTALNERLTQLFASASSSTIERLFAPASGDRRLATGDFPRFAEGGSFDAHQPFWAGEAGLPELIVPDSAGTVIPARELGRRAGGAQDSRATYIDARGATAGERERMLDGLQQSAQGGRAMAVHDVFELARRGFTSAPPGGF